jgi:MFS family permease
MHPWMVASGIFLLGVSNAGELTLSPTIFCEFCPPSKRYYLVMLSLFLSLGAVCVTGIALLVVLFNQTGFFTWRILAFALVFVQVGTVILKFSLDESPGYLCRVKEMRKAEEILNKISIRNKGITFEFDMATSVIGQHGEMGNVLPANSVLTDIQQNPPIWLIVKKLFGKKMVWTTLKISFVGMI